MLQINTFLVFAIIGAVFAGIQVIVGSTGANNVFYHYIRYHATYWQVRRINYLFLRSADTNNQYECNGTWASRV